MNKKLGIFIIIGLLILIGLGVYFYIQNTNTNNANTNYNTNLPSAGLGDYKFLGITLVLFAIVGIYAFTKIKYYKGI